MGTDYTLKYLCFILATGFHIVKPSLPVSVSKGFTGHIIRPPLTLSSLKVKEKRIIKEEALRRNAERGIAPSRVVKKARSQ